MKSWTLRSCILFFILPVLLLGELVMGNQWCIFFFFSFGLFCLDDDDGFGFREMMHGYASDDLFHPS